MLVAQANYKPKVEGWLITNLMAVRGSLTPMPNLHSVYQIREDTTLQTTTNESPDSKQKVVMIWRD